MTLREMMIRCANDTCEHYPKKQAYEDLDELISFCSIWADVIDANLEDLEIRRVPEIQEDLMDDPDLPF